MGRRPGCLPAARASPIYTRSAFVQHTGMAVHLIPLLWLCTMWAHGICIAAAGLRVGRKHDWGLFARRPLAAGTLLGEFCGLVCTGAVSQSGMSPASSACKLA